MNIKIDNSYLKFPFSLPNDLESFMVFYPKKFPLIVSYYEEVAKKAAIDPIEFRKYGNWAKEELWKGFEKINNDYQNGNQDDLEFLVNIDQRMHKLCCYRFWIVNYLFADGPLHDFFITNLKVLIRKFIDATEDIEDYEQKVVLAERDLMQTDYADLYLDAAMRDIETAKLIEQNKVIERYVKEIMPFIKEHKKENVDRINAIWTKVVEIIKDEKNKECEALRENLKLVFDHAKWVGKPVLVLNRLTHAIEFEEENEGLKRRYDEMTKKIEELKNEAKSKLSPEDYEIFELSYEQIKNFGTYKDIMGAIDPEWLPMWFGLHKKVREIVKKPADSNIISGGHSAMFYELVWFLPAELKDKVFSIDNIPFSLETL